MSDDEDLEERVPNIRLGEDRTGRCEKSARAPERGSLLGANAALAYGFGENIIDIEYSLTRAGRLVGDFATDAGKSCAGDDRCGHILETEGAEDDRCGQILEAEGEVSKCLFHVKKCTPFGVEIRMLLPELNRSMYPKF